MSYLIFALGLLLAICGAASISFGYGIIRDESGWASVIGGAAALSGGIVTIALAAILHSLSGLRTLLAAGRDARFSAASALSPKQVVAASEPETPIAAEQKTVIAAPSPAGAARAPVLAGPPPGSGEGVEQPANQPANHVEKASIDDIRRVVAESIKRQSGERGAIETKRPAADVGVAAEQAPRPIAPPRPIEAAARRKRETAPFGLPRALGLKDIPPQPSARAERPAGREAPAEADRSGARRDAPASTQTAPAPAPATAGSQQPHEDPPGAEGASDVIGRYESEGTSYVMFADGSIDARSDLGAFRFSSMAELKAFMEAQSRG